MNKLLHPFVLACALVAAVSAQAQSSSFACASSLRSSACVAGEGPFSLGATESVPHVSFVLTHAGAVSTLVVDAQWQWPDHPRVHGRGHPVNTVTAPVPEPETYALLLAGLAVIGLVVHRRGLRG